MTNIAQSISYPSGKVQIDGYLALPEGEGPFPAIVVIHEAFGLKSLLADLPSA